MAHRSGLIDDLLHYGTRAQPRVGVALAVVSWLILHVAGTHGIARYLLPMMLLAGSLFTFRPQLKTAPLGAPARDELSVTVALMNWQSFERLIAATFRNDGFAVVELDGKGPESGIDFEFTKDGKRFLAQCTHWKSWQVGVSTVHELTSLIAREGAHGGYVITTGRFTHEARR